MGICELKEHAWLKNLSWGKLENKKMASVPFVPYGDNMRKINQEPTEEEFELNEKYSLMLAKEKI
jgi:hypothetical protein